MILLQDLRYAARTLARNPGFAALAVLTLALGIGATTAVFSVVDAVLLRPLPVRDQDRIVVAWQEDRARGFSDYAFRFGDYEAVRERSRALSGVAALPRHGVSHWVARAGAAAITLAGTPVTGEFFQVLGVRPTAGRLLEPSDDVRGAPLAVVLSYMTWQRAFGGDPHVVGRTIELTGRHATIIGIAGPGFDYPRGVDAWVAALAWWNPDVPPNLQLALVGRLAPGATAERARKELDAIAAEARAERGDSYSAGLRVFAQALTDVVVGQVRPALLLIAAAVALLLLIAGLNVANLLLVRGIDRRREFAVRTALGAGRGRLARQLLTETIVLGLIGGALGVVLASWGISALLALAPPELPRLDAVAMNGRVLGFAVFTSLLSATLFGLLPALTGSSAAPAGALAGGNRALGPGGAARRARHALVVAQIAVTLVVLTGAGLLLKSFARLNALDPGFRPERLTLMEISAPWWKYETRDAYRRLFDRVLERVRALPGVVAASGVVSQPFSGSGGIDAVFTAEGQDAAAAAANPWLNYEGVEPDYFRTMGLPVLRGRGFTAADREDAPLVVVVNETLAGLMWPGENPVGKRIKLGRAESERPWITIVGIVADARYRTFEEVRPSVYLPFEQGVPVNPNHVIVRTRADAQVVPAVRRVLAEVEPDLVIRAATPMEKALDRPLARPRFQTLLLGLLAALGLVLSAVGLYGVVSYAVTTRSREIGLRMALGAQRHDVVANMVRGAATLTGTGILLGLLPAAAGTRLLRSLLFQVDPLDATTFAAVALVMAAVALLAAFLPARRAAGVDPMEALRAE